MVHSNNDFQDSYHDDPADNRRNRGGSKGISGLLALVLTIFGAGFYLQTTLAPNVSINSGGALEFGQGSARTVACSEEQSLIITPLSSFTNSAGAGSYKFSSIKVTNIPTACRGQDFIFSAYNNVANSAAQAIFNTSSTRAVVHMTEGDNFEKGIGGTGLSVTTNSASSFTVTFTTPVVTSSAVFNLTVESAVHTHVPTCAEGGDCVVGDIGPGGGVVYYYASSGFNCGPDYNATGSPSGSKCNYLEAAPTSGVRAWDPSTTKWSDNTTTRFTGEGSLGSGYQATLLQTSNPSIQVFAAERALAYRGPNNLTDWFLPTRYELIPLYDNRALITDFSSRAGSYSTSSEQASYAVKIVYFPGGSVGGESKTGLYNVLPIRAF